MSETMSPEKRTAVLVSGVGFLIAAILLTNLIPPVEGLGSKVRLPMFHGGSTWVNMAAFTLMGLFALGYLVWGKRDLYRWGAGFRYVAAPLWLSNTILGVVAAIGTWDFTGSQQSPFVVMQADPRLMTQFILLISLVALLLIDRIVESDHLRAFGDVVFAVLMWVLLYLRVFANAEARALHPDNPVLNSAIEIQAPFFGIVGCLLVAACLFAWLIRDGITRRD
ncbi:MAG: hypothetical protein KJ747_11200 [Actinobacteria bacterium]|nr:hypothetical protein [Actinomycetota bacterium]MCG2807995.1 hypothetical protein [Coriobacteriia bacterium]